VSTTHHVNLMPTRAVPDLSGRYLTECAAICCICALVRRGQIYERTNVVHDIHLSGSHVKSQIHEKRNRNLDRLNNEYKFRAVFQVHSNISRRITWGAVRTTRARKIGMVAYLGNAYRHHTMAYIVCHKCHVKHTSVSNTLACNWRVQKV